MAALPEAAAVSEAVVPGSAAPPSPGAGRPTRAQAEQRHAQLLDQALAMFLEDGFEQTTIDAIAAAVNMTKRTVYARHADKRALFAAAVRGAIARETVPVEAMQAIEEADLERSLVAIATLRLERLLSPGGLRLQRIVNAESYRFPEIAELYFEEATRPPLRYLADLFRRHAARGAIVADDPMMLATAFLSMVIGSQSRAVVLGGDDDGPVPQDRVAALVRLFLAGARPR